MRLICPNCGAQYEVDDTVIPEQGRDVQCSNCGHTWFQQPAHKDLETAQELADEAGTVLPEGTDTQRESPETGSSEPTPQPDSASRQELAPEVAALLREEAERETAARKAESDVRLETQPDLGLDDAAQAAAERTAAARARMARLRGGDDAETDASLSKATAGGPRKELLPDVDEINSSLNPSTSPESTDASDGTADEILVAEKQRSRSAGKIISRLIVVVAIVALAAYVLAPQIVEQVPQAEPYLVSYVNAINGLRAQIDPLIAQVSEQVQGLIGGGSE